MNADPGPPAAGPYSHAVISNGLAFLSGQVHLDPDTGRLIDGSIGDKTRRCLDNLQIVAKAAGTSLENAVRMGIFVTDISVFGEVNEAYGAYFPSDPPARSTVGVAELPMGAVVEIEAILALPD